MKVKLIPIGNSKGIRIPKSVIEACGFGDRIDMRVDRGVVVLAPARGVREGWEADLERMAAAGDDAPIVPGSPQHDWDDKEWRW
jgi:antitoxin MazE